MPVKASSRPNLMGRSRQGMSIKASSRPSQKRCWQSMSVKASSIPNLMGRPRQGVSVKASSRPNLAHRSRQGMPVKASSRPSRELQENSALMKMPRQNLPGRVRKECVTLFNSVVIKLEVRDVPRPRYNFLESHFN